MSTLVPMHLAEATERERFRRDRWSTMSLDQKIEALNVRVEDEVDRLYNHTLPEVDEQINRTLHEAYAVGDKATQAYSDSVEKLSELERLIRTCLQATVNELIAKSNSKIVTNALREALKSTILKVRPASREDLKSGDDVLVVRQASPAELRQQ